MSNLDRARELRGNLTDVERLVWSRLRSRRFAGYKFRRQMPIGHYVVDFVCLERRLILELDGSQHIERAQYDAARTAWLNSQGFDVLRFWNHEALGDWDAVEEVIWRRLQGETAAPETPLTPAPSPARGEGRKKSPAKGWARK